MQIQKIQVLVSAPSRSLVAASDAGDDKDIDRQAREERLSRSLLRT